MSKTLIVEYEGTDTLDVTLIEQSIKAIHESEKGKMLKIEKRDNSVKPIDVFFPAMERGGLRA